MAIDGCRSDFPLLSHLHYLDSASVSLTPVQVADLVREFDLQYRANVGRGVHRLARMATLRMRRPTERWRDSSTARTG